MNYDQSFFEVWNYLFLFMSLSIMAVFTIDMIGHQNKTISAKLFQYTVLAGTVVGELAVKLIPSTGNELKLAIACILTLAISIYLPLKLRATDPEVKRRRGNGQGSPL